MLRYLLICMICLITAGCGGDASDANPEEAVRAWVARGGAAAEDKDRGALLEMISEDYVDGRGNDREKIADLLRLYFFRQNSIALLTSIDDITIHDDSAALVNLTVGMAGTNSSALGLSADAYNFEFELERLDDDWQLIGARWSKLGGQPH